MTSDAPVILWFRDDLRLSDHAALHAAIQTGRPVLPLFILDDASSGPWALGGASRWWLHHSLIALRQSLADRGASLTLRLGDSVAIVTDLAQQTGATDIFTGGSADPWSRRLDQAVAEALDLRFHRMRTTTLFHPNSVRTKTGGAYSVYTPFANACLALGGTKEPLPAPKTFRTLAAVPMPRHISEYSTRSRRARNSTLTAIMSATGCRNLAASIRVTSTHLGTHRPARLPTPASCREKPIRARSWTSRWAERGRWRGMRGFA